MICRNQVPSAQKKVKDTQKATFQNHKWGKVEFECKGHDCKAHYDTDGHCAGTVGWKVELEEKRDKKRVSKEPSLPMRHETH